ncbi:MAG TPA: AraC family transcriptional regulator [Candidatus Limnocylindrales bacterium]|nr:AraC family transcriptional regulator [Candidatus Limnocylindrales bacterium]
MAVPLAITAGASRVEQLAVPFGQVASLRFPAGLELPRHAQPDPTIAVVLSGGWHAGTQARDLDGIAPSVLVEPAGDIHAKLFGAVETAVVSLTLEAGRLGDVVTELTQRFLRVRDPAIELLARRAATELEEPDDVSPLAIEAAALELVARMARSVGLERHPAWLDRAREVLNDRYADSLSLDDIADAVGVEPERLARGFRRAYGESLGDYLRRIRVNAAAARLASTDEPIANVAGEVGFADQSHLTRWFARYLQTTPGKYRGATRGDPNRSGDLIRSGNSDLLPPF